MKARRAAPLAGAHDLPQVQQHRCCMHCRFWMDPKKAAQELRTQDFWAKVFHNRDDGHDLKPQHVGNPEDYSICTSRDCASHKLSTCKRFKDR